MIEIVAESKIVWFPFHYMTKVFEKIFCSVANRIVFVDWLDMSFSEWKLFIENLIFAMKNGEKEEKKWNDKY